MPSVPSGPLVDKRTFFAVGEKAKRRKAVRQARATKKLRAKEEAKRERKKLLRWKNRDDRP